ncbi:MAG: TetR/AcrR family transcriptional regulator [Chloroflexi bacterium]|nr:MAG: TetR/AcrR family transcriptional regulator [Chloroflexota bacterium]
MSKGEQTREMILAQAAQLFSRQGYFGSSLSDIMHETGLEKGGIYNHFTSKEQLALEAFDYSYALLDQRIRSFLAGKTHAVDRLLAIVSYFQSLIDDPVVDGGCPILNTAAEADDAYPVLRDRAKAAMDSLRGTFERIITKGIERQEIRPEVDVDTCVTVFIATAEGAVMLSKLYQDPVHMQRAVAYLTRYIETDLRA